MIDWTELVDLSPAALNRATATIEVPAGHPPAITPAAAPRGARASSEDAMHDRNGNPLKVGDTVSITGRITHLNPSEDYCNVDVETVHGRRPDGHKERITAINTGVMDKVEDDAGDGAALV